MCLLTSNPSKIAEKNIVVYKRLKLQPDGTYISPFMETKYNIYGENIADGNDEAISPFYYDDIIYGYKVESGWLHSYVKFDDAIYKARSLSYRRGHICVFKTIIPAGSLCYYGLHFGCLSYASKKLLMFGEKQIVAEYNGGILTKLIKI